MYIKLQDTHNDRTCDISLQGDQEEGGKEKGIKDEGGMEGVQKSERPFIVLLLKTRLIYTHTDYTCNISLKGGISLGGRRQGRISVGRKDLCLSIHCSSVKKKPPY